MSALNITDEEVRLDNSISLNSTQPVQSLHFHPNAANVLQALSQNTISLWDVQQPSKAAFELSLQSSAKGFWHAEFSPDGRTIAATQRDCVLSLWDPRASTSATGGASSHAGLKPSRVAWVGEQIVTTGMSKVRRLPMVHDI